VEGVEVRLMGPKEEEWFARETRGEIYPFLSPRRWSQWEGKGFPVRFVLKRDGILAGGTAFDVYDILNTEAVVLDLDIFFVREGFQRQGLGQHLLLEGLCLARHYYRRRYRWRVVGLLIETIGAADFYKKVLSRAGYNFSLMEAAYPEIGTTVTYFHVIVPVEVTKPG